MFNSLFGGGGAFGGISGGIGQGMNELREQEGRAEESLNPYLQDKSSILQQYKDALGQGANPADLLNHLISQYQESPYLQNQIQAGDEAANRAAAASGMLGSGAEQEAAASRAQGLRAQDMQNYLSNALGLRQQYLGGMGGLEQQQFGGSQVIGDWRNQLGQGLMGGYEQQAAAEAARKMAEQKEQSGLFGTIGSIIGGVSHLL